MNRAHPDTAAGAGDAEKVWSALPVSRSINPEKLSGKTSALDVESAEEYLHLVRYEARGIPDVMISSNQVTSVATGFGTDESSKIDLCVDFAPKKEWKEKVLSNFIQLRTLIPQLEVPMSDVRVPNARSINEWEIFCFGNTKQPIEPPRKRPRTTSEGSFDSEVDYDSSSEEEKHSGRKIEEEVAEERENGFKDTDSPPHAPSLTLLSSLNQLTLTRAIRRMLSRSLFRYSPSGLNEAETKAIPFSSRYIMPGESAWYYALFAFLETPLLPDFLSVLRQIFLLCCKQRLEIVQMLKQTEMMREKSETERLMESLSGLHILITLTSDFFRQSLPNEWN
jgi:Survival motor neuron (SMN) interacting protein 1 (SIP1)